jgi:hypothetical protein
VKVKLTEKAGLGALGTAGGREAAGGSCGGRGVAGGSSSQAPAGAFPVPAGCTEETPRKTGRGTVGIAGFEDVVPEGADDAFFGGTWAVRMAEISGRPTGV